MVRIQHVTSEKLVINGLIFKLIVSYIAMIVTIVAIVFPGRLVLAGIIDDKFLFLQSLLVYFLAISISMIVRSQTVRWLIKDEQLRRNTRRPANEEKILRLCETRWFKLLALSVCSAISAVVVGVLI